ncbi:MAG TPA: hypothetical protein VLB04_02935 [Methanotrichaceae archaeon]|nr:hypothetical protein [Methanotrichaceae archaeon]
MGQLRPARQWLLRPGKHKVVLFALVDLTLGEFCRLCPNPGEAIGC